MNNHHADILVIGSGLSGAIAALSAADEDQTVILITKELDLLGGNTIWAQGGIAYKGSTDSSDAFEKDIFNAGNNNNFKPAVKQLTQMGPKLVEELLINIFKVPFE